MTSWIRLTLLLIAASAASASGYALQLGFVFDAAGNVRYRTNGSLIQTFTSDSANQLGSITRNGSMTVSGATPGPANVTVNGAAAQTNEDFTFAAANQSLANGNNPFTVVAQKPGDGSVTNVLNLSLPSSITLLYDANGNLTNDGTRSFIYDAENRLTNIFVANAWKSDFVFDGLGRRRVERDYAWQGGQWKQTNEVHFVWDGWLPIQERDSNNAVLVTYTRGGDLSGSLGGAGGIGGLLARTERSGNSAFYHADGAGNITGLIDANQNMAARYLWNPFGQLINRSGPLAGVNRVTFSTKLALTPASPDIFDFGGRDYFTGLQRWGNRDPLGALFDADLYRFNYNNPLSYVDPDGLAPQLTGLSYNFDTHSGTAQYTDQQFGQGYGNGLHGPLDMGPLGALDALNEELDRETQDTAQQIADRLGWGDDPSAVAGIKDALDMVTMMAAPEAGEEGALGKLGKIKEPCPKKPFWSPGKPKNPLKNAFSHWKKHGGEFPNLQNSKQYVEAAQKFVSDPPPGTLTKIRDGDLLLYDPASNTFAVRAPNGAPRTMFQPSAGMNYWNAQ
jgi:RHS repeat-associated protein